jgi:hypothetical protein
MQVALLALAGLGLLLLAGPQIADRFDLREERPSPKCLLQAPVIVVGVVESVEERGRSVRAARYPEIPLQAYDVTIRLESILRAPNPLSPQFRFYYFGAPPGKAYSFAPKFEAAPGQRYVFFLTYDGKELRSVGDYFEYSIRVESGSHSSESIPASGGDAVAQTLLREGTGVNVDGFVRALDQYASISRYYLTDSATTTRLLQGLTNSRIPEIRVQGCITLGREFPDQRACVQRLLSDHGIPDQLKKRLSYASSPWK